MSLLLEMWTSHLALDADVPCRAVPCRAMPCRAVPCRAGAQGLVLRPDQRCDPGWLPFVRNACVNSPRESLQTDWRSNGARAQVLLHWLRGVSTVKGDTQRFCTTFFGRFSETLAAMLGACGPVPPWHPVRNESRLIGKNDVVLGTCGVV